MSISRRALYEAGLPFGDGATYRKATGGRVYGDGGGSSAPTKQTTVTDIPDWAKPYGKEILGKAQALTDQPYQPYTGGERIAGFTPLQQQAQAATGTMTTAPQLQAATGLAGAGALQSLGAGQQYQQMATTPGAMQAYMSPYMQGVVDIQQREAQRQADIARTGRGAQAVKSGAFGGARQAIMEAEAGRNLQQQLADIQERGLQSAFDRAQQAQQFGATLGLQGAQQAGQLAQTLGGLGATQFGQQKDIIGLQSAAGKEQQALEQQRLDQQYQDFIRQQQYPYQQLGFMSDMLRGVPVGQTSQTIFQQPPASTLGQLAGLGTGLYGMSQMGFKPFAEGGPVAKYADQGSVTSATNIADIVDGLSDEQLQAAYQSAVARQDVKTAQIIQEEMADRAMTREGRGLAAAADIPEDMFSAGAAKGGIMKFAGGTNPYGYDADALKAIIDKQRREDSAINAPQGGAATATGVPPVAPGLTRTSLVQQGMALRGQPLPEPSAEDPYLEATKAAQAREIEAAAASRKAQEEGFAIDRKESAERIRELKESGLGAAIAALGFSAARAASKPGATLLGSFSEGTKDMETAMSANRKSLKEARDADKALAREERKLRIAMDEGDAKRAAEHQREISKLRAEKARRDDEVRRTNAIIRGNEVSGLAALAGALPQEPVPGELLQVADRLKKADPSLSDTAAMEQAAKIIQTKSPSYLTPGQLKPADLIRLANAYETQKRELIKLHPLAQLPNPTTPAAIKQQQDFQRRLRELQESFRMRGLPDMEMGVGGGTSSVLRFDARGNPIQ